jgi:hypothetical protein
MQMARSLTIFLLWLLGSGAAFVFSGLCFMTAEDGKIHPAALISFIWGVALLAGAFRNLPPDIADACEKIAGRESGDRGEPTRG